MKICGNSFLALSMAVFLSLTVPAFSAEDDGPRKEKTAPEKGKQALKKSKSDRDPARWEKTIKNFEAGDVTMLPPKGAVLLVGGSNARRWTDVNEHFPKHQVINRGFGGARLSEVHHFADRIVLPYAPKTILVNAGGNDLGAGKSPAQIRETARALIAKVRAGLPDTRIYFLGLPLMRRSSVNPKARAVVMAMNKQLAELARSEKNVEFIDLVPAFLDDQGKYLPALFVKDGVHFSPKGYAIVAGAVGSAFSAAAAEGRNKQSAATAKIESKGKKVFFTGHSFFILNGYMAKKVDLLAKAAGKTEHQLVGYCYGGGRSGAVDKWWAKGADKEPRKSVAAGKVDVLTVCTYWMMKGSEQEKSIRKFVALMQKSNPKGQVYVISTKPRSDGPYKGGWDARTKAELTKLSGRIDKTRRYANNKNILADEINKSYGKEVIKEVPLYYGQALLRAEIIDGRVPGVKKQSELYTDAMGHVSELSELGQRLNAYTVFAAIYGKSPVGLHVPQWEKSGDAVQRAQNLALQKTAWAAVQAAAVTAKRNKKQSK